MASVAPEGLSLQREGTSPAPVVQSTRRLAAAAAPTRTQSGHLVHLTLTHRALRFIWSLVLVVQTLNFLQLTFFSYLYLSYVSSPDSVLRYLARCFLTTPQQSFLHTYAMFVGVVYASLSVLFAWASFTMVVGTLWDNQPSFALPERAQQSAQVTSPDTKSLHSLSAVPGLLRSSLSHAVGMGLDKLRRRVVHAWVACGVRGHYFDQAMLVRETIELFYQAVQADQISRRISHRAINYAYTALIAANALVHPVLTRLLAHDPPMRRFAVVFTDFFLDFVWGCVLPLWMFWPYLRLDRPQSSIQLFLANGFGSVENAQREVEQIVILSWSALMLTVLPFTSSLLSLRSVKKLLESARRIQSWSEVTEAERLASLSLSPFHRRSTKTMISDLVTGAPRQRRRSSSETHELVPIKTARIISFAHHLLSLGGLIVACIAFASSGIFVIQSDDMFRVWDSACRYPLTPWFASTPACAVWFLNCTQMGFAGAADDLDAAFALIHAESLVFLSLDDCPRLEMDASLLQFQNLRAIMVRKSSLESWPVDIALTHPNFPVLQNFILERSTLADDPRMLRGLVKGTWGESFESAFFVDTDITMLRVSDNATTWKHLRGWYCVRCGIQQFPAVVFRSTQLRRLVVEGTAITAMPSPPIGFLGESGLWPQLETLSFQDSHALDTISDAVWDVLATAPLQKVQLQGSNISAIPERIVQRLPHAMTILAYDTPLCRDSALVAAIPSMVCTPPS